MSVTVHVTINGARVPLKLGDDALHAIADAVHIESRQPSPYLTIREAADYLRCSRQRVDDLLSAGRLARIHEGRRVLITLADLEAHLRRKERR